MSRWIRVSTAIFDHDLFSEEPFTEREAWLWLISKAAWKATRHRIGGAMVDVPVGSIFVTLRELQDTWKWGSDYRVRTFLKLLQAEEMIVVDANAGKTLVTICNYSRYQNPERTENAETTQPERSENALKTPIHQDTNTSSLRSEDAPLPKKQKATRLSEDWSLPRAWGQWAVSEGFPEQTVRLEAAKFRDFWCAKSGKDATKLDWFATWRNWIRNCSKSQPGHGPPPPARTMSDAIDDFIRNHDHELSAGTTIDHDGGDYSPNVHLLASPTRR
jgi:hypothetical protein